MGQSSSIVSSLLMVVGGRTEAWNYGVGASGTFKIDGDKQLKAFFDTVGEGVGNYVVEEFITGDICSYDAVVDAQGNALFESMTVWPPSIMDIVNLRLDLAYCTPENLRTWERRTVKAFGIGSRFVHLEFFHLDRRARGWARKAISCFSVIPGYAIGCRRV